MPVLELILKVSIS